MLGQRAFEAREHGYVVQVQRSEDVSLEVFIQGHGCYALEKDAGQFDADVEEET